MSSFNYEQFRQNLDQNKYFKIRTPSGSTELKLAKEMTHSELAEVFSQVGYIQEGRQLLREGI